jgi:hypothetical protein
MLPSSHRIKPNVQDLVIIQLDGIVYVIIDSQMITLNVKGNSFIQPDNNKNFYVSSSSQFDIINISI